MNISSKIAFHTLGCKLNFSETSSLAQQAIDAGYIRVDYTEIADVYVINTCSVTENADKECAYIIRQLKRKNPDSKIVIIGCFAQLKPDYIASIAGVDMVLGANEKFELIHNLDKLDHQVNPLVLAQDIKDINNFYPSFSINDRTRTFLKIQDGCDYFCTFCTIPMARGRSRSDTIANTMLELSKAIDTGVKEIVLTGVNTGDFGKSKDGMTRSTETLYELMCMIETKFDNIRIRISSIEPNLLTQDIIDLVAKSPIFMPHFHIPLQCGSDEILKAMHRKYDTASYKEKIDYIKSIMPHASIGVDIIVGFPEEKELHFEESFRFLNELNSTYFHVFTYSERAMTRAVKSEDSIPIQVRRERNKRCRILSEKKKRAFYQSQIGKIHQVLFESDNDNGFILGYSENYIRYRMPYRDDWVHQVISLQMHQVDNLCMAQGVVYS